MNAASEKRRPAGSKLRTIGPSLRPALSLIAVALCACSSSGNLAQSGTGGVGGSGGTSGGGGSGAAGTAGYNNPQGFSVPDFAWDMFQRHRLP